MGRTSVVAGRSMMGTAGTPATGMGTPVVVTPGTPTTREEPLGVGLRECRFVFLVVLLGGVHDALMRASRFLAVPGSIVVEAVPLVQLAEAHVGTAHALAAVRFVPLGLDLALGNLLLLLLELSLHALLTLRSPLLTLCGTLLGGGLALLLMLGTLLGALLLVRSNTLPPRSDRLLGPLLASTDLGEEFLRFLGLRLGGLLLLHVGLALLFCDRLLVSLVVLLLLLGLGPLLIGTLASGRSLLLGAPLLGIAGTAIVVADAACVVEDLHRRHLVVPGNTTTTATEAAPLGLSELGLGGGLVGDLEHGELGHLHVVVGEAAVVAVDVPGLARELPVLIKTRGAATVEADRADVVILHVLALELLHVVGAGLEVDPVAVVVAMLVDGHGACPGLATEFASLHAGAAELGGLKRRGRGGLDELFLSGLELGCGGDGDKGQSGQHKHSLHFGCFF